MEEFADKIGKCRDLQMSENDINSKSNDLCNIYLTIIKSVLLPRGIDESKEILIPIGICVNNCENFVDKVIDIKLKRALGKDINLERIVTKMMKCPTKNPGFLGLYNLYSRDVNCEEYSTFSYSIKIKNDF